MDRGNRFIREKKSNSIFKRGLYLSVATFVVILIAIAVTFIVYNNKIKNSAYKSLQTQDFADLVPNLEDINNTETASTEIGKSIEEVIKETEEKLNLQNQETQEESKLEETEDINTIETAIPEEKIEVEIKDPEFIMPVDGEIVKEFAKDSLIYSNTLEEWVTHLGIDIKADRTSIVKSAEQGKVLSIKNDPRYGLTVVIEHTNGYKTVYSNLLTAEFIKQGEQVEKGQTIGTVGNSAVFEISDEPHLHFEILKDNENLDPREYV